MNEELDNLKRQLKENEKMLARLNIVVSDLKIEIAGLEAEQQKQG